MLKKITSNAGKMKQNEYKIREIRESILKKWKNEKQHESHQKMKKKTSETVGKKGAVMRKKASRNIVYSNE